MQKHYLKTTEQSRLSSVRSGDSYEMFEDTEGIIRMRIWKKNRQHIGQRKNDKKTNNDLKSSKQKTKDRAH